MLDIGKNNLFISNSSSLTSRLLKSYEHEHTCLFFDRNNQITFGCSTIKYFYYEEIFKSLEENLFRVTLLVIEVGNLFHSVIDTVKFINTLREITDLPIILVSNIDTKNFDGFDYVYKLDRDIGSIGMIDIDKYEEEFKNNSYIKDIKNDWTKSLSNLETEYIRNEKLKIILNKKK